MPHDYRPQPIDRLLDRYRVLRADMVAWLSKNDANGEYTDAEHDAQGWDRLTVDDCASMLLEAKATGAVAGDMERYRCALARDPIKAV